MRVAYEDAHLIVIDKPSGLATHSGPTTSDDVYSRLCQRYPYVGLHHRLDLPTSGLVLFTLDRSVNAAIADAFQARRIARTYKAVLVGRVSGGLWDRQVDGEPARTQVKVHGMGQGMSAVLCRLETGRTHQIRIHAALAGHPVVGDRKHGGEAGRMWPRLALHAARLRFVHPVLGTELEVEAPIPDDLAPLWTRATQKDSVPSPR